jgi:membrane protein YdbS with pleckstrin-like domain
VIGDEVFLRTSAWCYSGVWSLLSNLLCVPHEPPSPSGIDDRYVRSFRPAEGYLRYLKFTFWIVLLLVDIALIIGWVVVLIASPIVGLLLSPLWWAVIIVPDIIAYIAIHLRYDTTWYVLSDRSMRLRRGIVVIHEVTITYENIQNVSVRQGPLQRYFGISDVLVETAGGGGSSGAHGSQGTGAIGHHGLLQGIDNAAEVRDLIIAKWRAAKSAGIGDDRAMPLPSEAGLPVGFDPQALAVMEEIRDLAVLLARS